MVYDIVIKEGTIIDPKTRRQTVGNIGIKDGKIETVCREELQGKEVFNAKDKIVCPGFIDLHAHLHFPYYNPWLSVKQGITTSLSGNCGKTEYMPVKEFLDKMEERGYPLNFGTMVGHSWTLRREVGLEDPYASATPEQTAKMVEKAEKALEEGAFGVSLGLEYAPGSMPEEYMPVVALAAKYDKLVSIHIRTDALNFAVGLREAIAMSEETGVRLQISHLAYQFGVHPEVTEMALCMINNAVNKGLPILCDSGMYTAFATIVGSAVFDLGWNKRYGCAISDLMISTGKYAGQRATQEIIDDIRATEPYTAATAFVGVESDLGLAIKQPYTMVSTDSGLSDQPGNGHPQDAGTYPRLFEKLVREQGVISMMDAVYKCSYLPAKQIGLDDRKGWIGTGADADIVIFDPRTIKDNADYIGIGVPDAAPSGIEHVIVNGVQVVDNGTVLEDKMPGQILRKPNKIWTM